ncbi:MAG: hypothetical protein C7B44_15325 [Sulfobacillus thermosulfidooxidans]|uniref:Uncharacterized protein n=1 Tax=Sulfobacillus acidophilus TaxID=53633 RepID=A0A2T2WCH1_9FIRM|nr:MAG: hypothetical protein C7B45_17505 [Sulfobacillus acidophilus]PSR32480.1 MAG: hypothetical protein C7B44_15325 [Sulfobacillus thermosulfidooxidans]
MSKIFQDVQTILGGVEIGSHIGITEMQRQTKWRETFNESKILEVLDRNETFAVLLKPELLRSLRFYIEQLEQEVEQLQLDVLFAQRQGTMNWTTGTDLKDKAHASLTARRQNAITDRPNADQS